MGSELKIRALTVADRDVVSGLIEKLVAELGSPELLRLMVTDPEAKEAPAEGEDTDNKRYALFVIEIIKMAMKYLSSDVRAWFASLINVAPEEFKNLPFDTEVLILEQLVEVEKVNRFFSRLLALFRGMKGYADGLRAKSEK